MEALMTYSQAFFGWVLQTTLIASLVVCLILLIQKMLGGKLGPRWCHALWLVLLIRMILPWSPSSRVSLSNLISLWKGQTQLLQLPDSTGQQNMSVPIQTAETHEVVTGRESEPELAAEKQVAPRPRMIANAEAQSGPRLVSLRRVLPILWLAGAIVIGAYLLVSDLALWRIVKRDRPLLDQSMLELFEECKAQMGVQSLVVVVPSDQVRSPGLFGFVRPRLLLPRQMLDMATAEEMRYVFLHELAHLRRHDIYLGWLTSLLQVLHWFNPLVWFAFYRMRADRELACDALVLTRTGQDKSQEYGGAIVGLVRRFSRSHPLPAMAGIIESKSQLKRRIAMITKFRNKSYRFSPLAAVLIIILAFISLPDAISTQASQIPAKGSAPPITLRRAWSNSYPITDGEPSPDGRYLSYTDWETGDLAVYEIATGTKRRLTNKGTWDDSDETAYSSRWSPDGKQIVYGWEMGPDSVELRLTRLDGSEPQVLYHTDEQHRWVEPCGWFPDGRHILASLTGKDGTDKIVRLSVEDGSLHVLKTVGKDCLNHVRLSPNGQYIAYDFNPEDDDSSLNLDISLISQDGSNEVALVKHPAVDFVLGWAPDGKHILFASDRTGTLGIWITRVANGKPQGDPELVTQIARWFEPMGFANDGSYYYSTSRGSDDAYIATLDQETGKITAPLKKAIERHEGSNIVAAYSPDGSYIAYIHGLGFMPPNRGRSYVLCIYSLETGKEREHSLNLSYIIRYAGLRWSPDGRSILVAGRNGSDSFGNYTIDVRTGDTTHIRDGRSGVWSHDGKSLLYLLAGRIMACNLETNNEEVLYRSAFNEFIFNMALSPDGQWLALRCIRPTSLKILPAGGGEARELPEFEKVASTHKPIAWTADSKYILFSGNEPSGGKHPLYRISVESGKAEKLGLRMNRYYGLSAHPNGRDILVSGSESAPESEVWVMEHFLAEAPIAKSEPVLTPTLRQIEVRGRGTRHSRPSFDGKYMSDVDRDSGNLVIRSISTAKQWNLTDKDSNSGDFADWSAISPDSTKVIYYWFNADKKDFDLRVVGLDGSNDRLLWGAREGARSFNIDAWSPDGNYVYGEFLHKEEPVRLVRVSIADGSRQVIKTFDEKRFFTVGSSPDGRYIAYDCAKNKSSNRDIYIYDLKENTENPLIRHEANDKLLGWTPDGRHIFFTSDRNGTWDGWLLRIVDGKPSGLPEVIKAGIGDVSPIGFTQDGSFYYTFNHEALNVYTAKLDLDTGRVLSEPRPVRHVGNDGLPDWSPDGRYLAYLSELDSSKPQIIRIRTLATNQERQLKTDLPYFRFLHWCPDSRHLLITDFKDLSAVYRLDVQTGEHTELVSLLQSEGQRIRQAELSSDGKTLAYRIRGRGTANRLVVKNMQTGHEKELLQTEGNTVLGFAAGWALSPDGKDIAFAIREGANSPFVLKIISVETGDIKDTGIEGVFQIAWTAGGSRLVFTKNLKELWAVSVAQGEPKKVLAWNDMLLFPSIHPDGQRIAFFSGGYVSEMWVMENFLPQAIAMGK